MEEKNLPDKADELLTGWLNKDPLIPAAISTIPVFGGPLATFYSGKWHQIHEQRTKALLQQFGEHVSSLDQQALRKDFFDTPEGIDLLIQADEQSSKTRSDEKRDLIARILARATSTHSEQGNYSPEEYVNIVASLTVKELEVARTIYELQRIGPLPLKYDAEKKAEIWKACEQSIIGKHSIDGDDLTLMLNRITATGLLRLEYELYASGFMYPTYWVAPTFDRLVDFMSLHPRT